MLQLRLRSCHLTGSFAGQGQQAPADDGEGRGREPDARRLDRIVLPPASFLHEKEKIEDRWPAAVEFIKARRAQRGPRRATAADVGIIVQGGVYNTLNRSMELLGCSDAFGDHRRPALRDERDLPGGRLRDPGLLRGQASRAARRGGAARLHRAEPERDPAPRRARRSRCTARTCCRSRASTPPPPSPAASTPSSPGTCPTRRTAARRCSGRPRTRAARSPRGSTRRRSVPGRRACAPAARSGRSSPRLKLAEKETGKQHHVSADIGCHLFAINEPFNLGATTMGYGLGLGRRRGAELQGRRPPHRRRDGRRWLLAQRPDQRRGQRGVQPERPAAAGRRQRLQRRDRRPGRALLPAPTTCCARPSTRSRRPCAESASTWVKTVNDTYRVGELRDLLVQALTTEGAGPQGRRRPERVPAQQAAPGEAATGQGDQGGQAGREGALRRRRRDVHRRPRLHPDLRVPVADHQAQPGPDADRPGRHRAGLAASAAGSAVPTPTRPRSARRSTAPTWSTTHTRATPLLARTRAGWIRLLSRRRRDARRPVRGGDR